MALVDSQVGSFTIPATSGNYAPERVWIGHGDKSGNRGFLADRIQAVVTAAVAASVLELWACQAGADPSADASYYKFGTIANGAAVGGAVQDVAGGYFQLRAKSGGTAGTLSVTVNASKRA